MNVNGSIRLLNEAWGRFLCLIMGNARSTISSSLLVMRVFEEYFLVILIHSFITGIFRLSIRKNMYTPLFNNSKV